MWEAVIGRNAHGTRVDRVAPLLVGHTAGFHVHLVAKTALIKEVTQNDLTHRRTADIAGADGHYGVGLGIAHSFESILNRASPGRTRPDCIVGVE